MSDDIAMPAPTPYDNYDHMIVTDNELAHRFSTHKVSQPENDVMDMIRQNALALASYINTTVPDCREKAKALVKLEETVWWANAGIARRRTQ